MSERMEAAMQAMRTVDHRLALLEAVAHAANELDGYEDFSERTLCSCCAPEDPGDYLAARRELYDTLFALRTFEREQAGEGLG